MSASVIQVFVDLYNKGLIYRGFRMVNWDPEAQTTLSDEEVIFEEKPGFLYHIAYELDGVKEPLVIATTRPETIFGDTAICIHPEDPRFEHLKGEKVKVPIADREITVIADDILVNPDFGTGCVKVTPAHDPNDYETGLRNNLEMIKTAGKLFAAGQAGDRFAVRKSIVKDMEGLGCLVKKENHTSKVGTSERTNAIIEPRVSEQWFLKMKNLAKPAIGAVLEANEVQLIPKKFKNTYRN